MVQVDGSIESSLTRWESITGFRVPRSRALARILSVRASAELSCCHFEPKRLSLIEQFVTWRVAEQPMSFFSLKTDAQ